MHVKVLWEVFNDGLTLVPSGQEYEITLRCECRDFGEIRAPVAFGFKLQSTKEVGLFECSFLEVNYKDLSQMLPQV